MNERLRETLEEAIAESTGERSPIADAAPLRGGCIHNARELRLEDGRRFFLKSNSAPLPNAFVREAEGLQALADSGAFRIPRPLAAFGEDEDDGGLWVSDAGAPGEASGEPAPAGISPAPAARRKRGVRSPFYYHFHPVEARHGLTPFLLTEFIDEGERGRNFWESFGRQFARMHRETHAPRFGFFHDNFIGSTPQPNDWADDWVRFWGERRLGYQLSLARVNGRGGQTLQALGDRLLDRLPEFIAEPAEPPCLLHGDLWGGNFLCDSGGAAVLIDPAAYYGRREADLAMTMLFGGFDARFLEAYMEAWPLTEGWKRRAAVYQLYHLLNHLNIFGEGYANECEAVLRGLVG